MLILLAQTVAIYRPRLAIDGVLPYPLLWELKRLEAQIKNILNWNK